MNEICDSCGEYEKDCRCVKTDTMRKRLWIEVFIEESKSDKVSKVMAASAADNALAMFDKRFPKIP